MPLNIEKSGEEDQECSRMVGEYGPSSMRLFNMLGYSTEFHWIGTLQNKHIFLTQLSPRPKYRLVLQCMNPNEYSMVYKHVK